MTEGTGAFLRRKHPRLFRRFRNEMLLIFSMGIYGGFILGLAVPSAWADLLTADELLRAYPLVGWFAGGFTLGLNLCCLLTLKLRERRPKR